MIRFLLDEGVNPAIHPTVGELTRGEWFNPFAFFYYGEQYKYVDVHQ